MTTFPVINPKTPFMSLLPKPLEPGQIIKIRGSLNGSGGRAHIFLQSDLSPEPASSLDSLLIVLCLSIRPEQQTIVRNIFQNGWGPEEEDGGLPIGINDQFKITILIRENHFKIAVNSRHYCAFKYRLPLDQGKCIHIDGACTIQSIRHLQDNSVLYSIARNQSKIQELSEKVDEITALLQTHQISLNSQPN